MFDKRVCNVYINEKNIHSVTINKSVKSNLHSELVEFTPEEKEQPAKKMARIIAELKRKKKQAKVTEFNLIYGEGHRLSSVVELKAKIKAKKELGLVLRSEISKDIANTENIDQYVLAYEKLGELVYLVSLMEKKVVEGICTMARAHKIPLGCISTVDDAYYKMLKRKGDGKYVLLHFEEATATFGIFAIEAGVPMYSRMYKNFAEYDIQEELVNLVGFIGDKTERPLDHVYLAGDMELQRYQNVVEGLGLGSDVLQGLELSECLTIEGMIPYIINRPQYHLKQVGELKKKVKKPKKARKAKKTVIEVETDETNMDSDGLVDVSNTKAQAGKTNKLKFHKFSKGKNKKNE